MMRSRRNFLKTSGGIVSALSLNTLINRNLFASNNDAAQVPVYAHLWVYASRYPPDWDCTPILDDIFSDLKYAGVDGVEVMEVLLRRDGAVTRFKELIQKYDFHVSGTSYGADMWNKKEHQKILEDAELIVEKLRMVGGETFGITVGDPERVKTEDELDAQAELLKKIIQVCEKNNVEPNLHNHTFEVANNLHDLKGTLKRIPGVKLGPDLNWLVRAGIDPGWFIKTYGHQIVYMHIRDQRADGKWTEAVGDGVTDFNTIAKAFKDINYNHKAAIELAFDEPAKNPLREDWKKSREYVKKVFGW